LVRRRCRRASKPGIIYHRLRLTPRHHSVDGGYFSFPQAHCMVHGIPRYRLPRRLIYMLVAVRAHPSADLSIRRQPYRRGPRLWDLFPLQSNRSGHIRTRFVAIAKALVACIGIDAGHDGDRIYGPRADSFSGLAANGGIFRAGADIRMADRGHLVSHTGSDGHAQKRASGKLVRYKFGALAVIAPPAIGAMGGGAVHRLHCFWLLTTGCPG